MAEVQNRRLVGQGRRHPAEAGEATKAFYLVQGVFHLTIRVVEPVLRSVKNEGSGPSWLTARASVVCKVVRTSSG